MITQEIIYLVSCDNQKIQKMNIILLFLINLFLFNFLFKKIKALEKGIEKKEIKITKNATIAFFESSWRLSRSLKDSSIGLRSNCQEQIFLGKKDMTPEMRSYFDYLLSGVEPPEKNNKQEEEEFLKISPLLLVNEG